MPAAVKMRPASAIPAKLAEQGRLAWPIDRTHETFQIRQVPGWALRANAASKRSHNPACDQRRQRVYTEFQGSKTAGKSRQGQPTRRI